MRWIIMVLTALMVIPMSNADFRGNHSMPTVYDADMISLLGSPDETSILLEIGHDNPSGLGLTTITNSYITMNTSLLSGVTIDAVWTNINVHSTANQGPATTSFNYVNSSDPNNAYYVTGMTKAQIDNITTTTKYYNSLYLTTGLKVVSLGNGAVNNLTSVKNNNYFSIAMKDASSPPNGDEYTSFFNSTEGSWPSHFTAEYDCTPPSSGKWTLEVYCHANNEEWEVDSLEITSTGFLDMTNSFMNVTGDFDISGGLDLDNSGIDVG